MFYYDWPLLSSWKISGLSVQLFTFFEKKCHFFIIFAKKYFSTKIFTVLHQSKKELSDWDQNWAKTRPLLFKTFEISNAMDSHIVHSLIKTNLPIYKLSVFFSGFVWLMYGRMNLKCNHSCNSTPKSLPGCI